MHSRLDFGSKKGPSFPLIDAITNKMRDGYMIGQTAYRKLKEMGFSPDHELMHALADNYPQRISDGVISGWLSDEWADNNNVPFSVIGTHRQLPDGMEIYDAVEAEGSDVLVESDTDGYVDWKPSRQFYE
jgi:hypothetical protein